MKMRIWVEVENMPDSHGACCDQAVTSINGQTRQSECCSVVCRCRDPGFRFPQNNEYNNLAQSAAARPRPRAAKRGRAVNGRAKYCGGFAAIVRR